MGSVKIKTPVIVLNVKAYRESAGERGVALAKTCEEVTRETGVATAICPQQIDLTLVVKKVKIPVLTQHAEPYAAGSYTGHVVLESVKAAGANGTLLNHSEHPMKIVDIDAVIRKAKELELMTIACANNTDVSTSIAALHPTSIAIEPPALIGSGIPVSKADPNIVRNSVEAVKRIHDDILVLCGAGISTGSDIKAALELGVEGVLLASGVVKAEDQKAALLDLASGVP